MGKADLSDRLKFWAVEAVKRQTQKCGRRFFHGTGTKFLLQTKAIFELVTLVSDPEVSARYFRPTI